MDPGCLPNLALGYFFPFPDCKKVPNVISRLGPSLFLALSQRKSDLEKDRSGGQKLPQGPCSQPSFSPFPRRDPTSRVPSPPGPSHSGLVPLPQPGLILSPLRGVPFPFPDTTWDPTCPRSGARPPLLPAHSDGVLVTTQDQGRMRPDPAFQQLLTQDTGTEHVR